MRASKLRNRIKVYEAQTVGSPMGGSTTTKWTHILTLWANVEPLSVRDTIIAQTAGSQTVARCKIRYRDDIDTTMRIEHRGRTYEIDGDPLPDKESGLEFLTIKLKGIRRG